MRALVESGGLREDAKRLPKRQPHRNQPSLNTAFVQAHRLNKGHSPLLELSIAKIFFSKLFHICLVDASLVGPFLAVILPIVVKVSANRHDTGIYDQSITQPVIIDASH